MDAPAKSHPTDQTLSAYGLGKLDDASAEAVNQHLESCARCRGRVAEVSSDTFLGRLRDAKVQGPRDSPAEFNASTAGLSITASRDSSTPEPPPPSSLPPGLRDHPDYKILRELGKGGMGVVYLAENLLMERKEVLKVVSGHVIKRRGVLERFSGEIRNAARLHHPNVVTAYAVIRLGESLVLTMEYVDGPDLARLVKARGPLPVAHACYYVHQAALGLQHAHEHGMVHRDIKPANLMLSRAGKKPVVKVLDFGLAKVASEGNEDSGLTREGQMLGTPDYIAPEQIRDARSADIRADIYSLGCTFYYLLTGRPPFGGDNLWDLYQSHFSMTASPLNLVRPEVPAELAALVEKMMAKEPELRFQEPKEVAQALVPFFKPTAAAAHVPATEVMKSKPESWVEPPRAPEIRPPALQPPPLDPPPLPRQIRPALTQADGAAWESLIATDKPAPLQSPAKPKSPAKNQDPAKETPQTGRPPWFWPALAGGLVLFALIFSWASVMIISPSRTESMTVRPEPRESNTSDGNQQTGLDKKTEESRKAAETNPWPKAIEDDGQPLPDGFRAAALSHDCQRLAIVSPNSEVLRVVAAPDATKLFEVDYHEYIWRAQFSPDGEYLAVRTYRGIKILSAAKGEELRRFANGCPNLAFSPDSERLAAESAGLHVWSASTGDVLANFPNHANWSWCVAFSPDGKLLASGSGRGNGQEDGSFAGEVRVWDLSTSSAIDFDGHPDRVSGLAFSPDGRWLASASYDRTVKVWELSTKKCLITFDKHEGAVGAVQFSPDGRLVASCGRDNPVRIWAPATGREIAALECPPGDYREDWLIQFSPAGRWIYSGKQSVLKVWETPEPDGEESVKTASTSGESNQEPDSAPEAVAEMPAEAEKVPETEEAPDPQQTSTTPEPTAVEVVEVANTAKAASTPATTATQPKPGTSVRKQTKNHVVASNRRARANQPPPVAGRWKHAASAPDANGGVIFTFVPDGSIRGPKGGLRGSWWQSGSMMVLRWPDKQAPGGAWVDRVELSPDRKRYDGFNQRRVAIHGLKVDR